MHGVVNMEGMGFGLLEEEGIKLLCIKYEQHERHSKSNFEHSPRRLPM
jgi:hypothetical protein